MIKRWALAASLIAMVTVIACGGSDKKTSTPAAGGTAATGETSASPGASGGNTTLKLAFLADMSVPDPDVFYDIEGNTVILSTYEGLLRYKPDSTDFEGVLASSWDVSADGMTYTFKLRPNVKFHDGTPFDSAAAKASFQRRLDVASAPAYMLADTGHPFRRTTNQHHGVTCSQRFGWTIRITSALARKPARPAKGVRSWLHFGDPTARTAEQRSSSITASADSTQRSVPSEGAHFAE